MVDTRKVKFARGIKNTAGFFTLLYAVVMLAYLIGVAFFFNNLEEVDAVFITGILLDAVEHLVLAIALFTATTPKWLWFPIGAFALAKGYLLYDFVTIFANNDYNINLVTRSDVYVVCTSLGYIILFVMLFAKGFAKSAWLIPAALISVQDFVFSLESGKGLPDYIELIKSGNNLIGIMLLLSFVGNVIFVISTFLICLYVGKYSKQRLLFKRIESIPSAPAASEPEVPLTNTVTNGSVNANTAPSFLKYVFIL